MKNCTSQRNVTSTMRPDSTLLAGVINFFAALNIFLLITACLGNGLILIALRKVSSVQPPTKLLFQCLAITDLGVGLIAHPLLVLFFTSTVPKVFKYVKHVKDALTATSLILCSASMLASTAISVDRLLALLLGLRHRHVVTLSRVRMAIVCFCLIGVFAALLNIFSGSFIGLSIGLVFAFLFLVISVFSCTKIFLKLQNQQAQVSQNHAHQGQQNGGGIPVNIARYKRTVSSIAWVQQALVVCYYDLPSIISFLVGYITNERDGVGEAIAWNFSVMFVYFSSSLNPIFYCWKINEVRQVVRDTVKQFCCSSS